MRFPAVALKIWIFFSVTLLVFSVLQFVFFAFQINRYSDREYLNLMAETGGSIIWYESENMREMVESQLHDLYFPEDLIEKIFMDSENQRNEEQSYEWKNEYEEILFSLKISRVESGRIINLTYLWSDVFRFSSLILDGFQSSLITLIVMLIPAYLVSISLVRPLLKMEKHALMISERNLSVPIEVRRRDEIGALGRSLEVMRKQLIEQDESQKRLFHSVSHELKTPIMVIRSHIQAIEDNVGDEQKNLSIIDTETLKLGEKVNKLISMTKLGYLRSHAKSTGNFCISRLLKDLSNSFSMQRRDIQWIIPQLDLEIHSSEELVTILFENILDNQIRFAANFISIELKAIGNQLFVEIFNDGPPVKEDELEKIFQLFYKSDRGCSGLGLSIALEICRILGGDIKCINRDGYSVFIMNLPRSHNFT